MHILCLKFPEYLLGKILSYDVKVSLVLDSWDVNNEVYLDSTLARLYRLYTVDSIDSLEELSAIYGDLVSGPREEVTHLLSGAEYSMYALGYLKSLFGASIDPLRQALLSRNKRGMKQIFRDANVPVAEEVIIHDRTTEIEESSFPAVVKPVSGTGSFNTSLVKDNHELQLFMDTTVMHPSLVRQGWLVERQLTGEEHHVDIVWRAGEPVFMSIGRYLVPRIETKQLPSLNGSVILSPRAYQDLYARVRELSIGVARNLQIHNGVTHAEIFVENDHEITFGEVATRFAGASIPQGIAAAFGVDIIDEWMRSELGFDSLLPQDYADRYVCAGHVSVTPFRSGKITDIPSISDYMSLPGVTYSRACKRIGDAFDVSNPSDWCVLLAMTASDEEAFVSNAVSIYETHPIKVT